MAHSSPVRYRKRAKTTRRAC